MGWVLKKLPPGALSAAKQLINSPFYLLCIPASCGFFPASAHLCVYSHMAIVAQGTQVGWVVHETVLFGIVDAILHRSAVMHFGRRSDVAH